MAAIKVLSTTAVKSSLDEIVPDFEATTGVTVTLTYTPSAQIAARVLQNESVDVIVGTKEILDELRGHGKLLDQTLAPIARSLAGLAVRDGAPRPDISSVAAFKKTLLNAKSIATSNPVGGGQSGKVLAAVLEKLGIADALKPKLLYSPGGPAGLVGFFLTRGEAEIGIQQMPELLAVPGVDVIGPLPSDITIETVFSVAVSATPLNRAGAIRFAETLSESAASIVLRKKGFSPMN
ncbi:MAG TPA: substrate-binding domain-containing protein [Xanthobacteraceae bacterium]|jgi:molybdate transport system substrate-binding protein|nr:substrate-binding domain-containing protein [Xanthobacteraceae bacterium]